MAESRYSPVSIIPNLIITRSILPLPLSNHHHSNRTDLKNRLVPLPPSHCHSSRHATQPTTTPYYLSKKNIFLTFLKDITTLPILPLLLSNHYHSNRTDLPNPIVQLPPSHCHSPCHATSPNTTPYHFIKNHKFFPDIFLNYRNSANTATTTLK
jgi:hypothetical protein